MRRYIDGFDQDRVESAVRAEGDLDETVDQRGRRRVDAVRGRRTAGRTGDAGLGRLGLQDGPKAEVSHGRMVRQGGSRGRKSRSGLVSVQLRVEATQRQARFPRESGA